MSKKPRAKQGLARIWAAFFYSLAGLAHAGRREAAFRQEAVLLILVGAVLVFLPFSLAWKIALLGSHTLILIVELLNSALEKVVDLVSPDYHILAKQAKDMGSGAVLLAFVLTIGLWVAALATVLVS